MPTDVTIPTPEIVFPGFAELPAPIQDAIDAPRFHHQWLPDQTLAEPRCFSPDTWSALAAMGHNVVTARHAQGSVMALLVRPDAPAGRLEAGVDRRRPDGGAAGR